MTWIECAREIVCPWYEKMFDPIGSFFVTLWSWIVAPFKWLGGLFAAKIPAPKKVAPPAAEKAS